ncbi:MAG: hypothetical protein DRJ31_04750 [Candidatus Methanomethylicota archaeon]|uniref:Type I-A CRISPR-associated protein Csa5 n=1 Tax=Thermoproteota archaeon TaxID=2056631 RepID=A0A497EQ33_9CREN|nr:MAG: hypothetical protein DRJ31_04750 [Candidatus Verstraetearchaeota archaeon]
MKPLTLHLPPEDTFLHLVLKTAITFIAGHAGIDIHVEGTYCEVSAYDDRILVKGFHELHEHLKEGAYGIEPWLPDADRRDRLGNLASVFNLNVKDIRVSNIIDRYINYVKERATKEALIKELSDALGKFYDDGYLNDTKLVNIPMLNRLSPEYMEALRVFGGAGLASVPTSLGFRRLTLGLHSTCLGLMGLWIAHTYSNGAVEYYIFPSLEAVKHKVSAKLLEQITKQSSNLMMNLKGRPFTSANVLALVTALSTAGAPPMARKYQAVIFMRGGRRVELIEGFTPLSIDKLHEFADILLEICSQRDLDTVNKLIRIARMALSKATGNITLDASLKICQNIVNATLGVVRFSDAVHVLARYSYAQENPDLAHRIGLTISDVDAISEALQRLESRYQASLRFS